MLGPVLFVIFINDLPEEVQSQIYLFTDDTKIYCQINSEEDIKILKSDRKALDEWSRKWLLLLHPDKCKVLNLDKHGTPAEYCMTDIGRNQEIKLEVCESEKELGIWMDSDVSFEKHIAGKVKKMNRNVGITRCTFTYLYEETFLLLYNSQVRPNLEYANPVWSPYKVKHKEVLEICTAACYPTNTNLEGPKLRGMIEEVEPVHLSVPESPW